MNNPFDSSSLTAEEKLTNVARALFAQTEVKRYHNGRGRRATYAADVDAIAGTGRQLAEMVLEYLGMQA